MRQVTPAIRRWFIACLLAMSVLAVSVAAFAPAHLHGGVKSDACAVCKASETPADSTNVAVAIWPPTSLNEYVQAQSSEPPADSDPGSTRSRAPPSL
jgi:hypothetical protein